MNSIFSGKTYMTPPAIASSEGPSLSSSSSKEDSENEVSSLALKREPDKSDIMKAKRKHTLYNA